MQKWHEDVLIRDGGVPEHYRLSDFSTPAFRLSLQASMIRQHPLEHVDAYEELFDVFRPILQRDAERLLMTEVAGKNPRRRKSIRPEDWEPFRYMQAILPDPKIEPNGRYFVGFDYQSGVSPANFNPSPTGHNRYDIGPTKCFLHITVNVKFDATVPVTDFENGTLDINRMKAALLNLPVATAISGYGFCVSDTFDWPVGGMHGFHPVARKYPVVDFALSNNRDWSSADEEGSHPGGRKHPFWHSGLNWLTLIGEPFLSALGGVEKLTAGLSKEISWEKGRGTVLFQLGDRPISGEQGIDDDLLPLYFELGERLRPVGNDMQKLYHRVFGNNGDYRNQEVMYTRRFYDRKWFEEND